MACGPGHLELSKSYMDMASKLFTFTYIYMWRAPPIELRIGTTG